MTVTLTRPQLFSDNNVSIGSPENAFQSLVVIVLHPLVSILVPHNLNDNVKNAKFVISNQWAICYKVSSYIPFSKLFILQTKLKINQENGLNFGLFKDFPGKRSFRKSV